MTAIKSILKLLVLIAFFFISYSTRIREALVEDGDGSFELRSGNLVAGTLEILFLPVFILSVLALYYSFRKPFSRWTVRCARYFAYILTLSTHLLAFHIGQWNAVFNPIAILADHSEDFTMRMISAALALFFLASTIPALFSFLYGKTGEQGDPIPNGNQS